MIGWCGVMLGLYTNSEKACPLVAPLGLPKAIDYLKWPEQPLSHVEPVQTAYDLQALCSWRA